MGLGVGNMYTFTVASAHTWVHVAGGVLVTMLSTVSFLQCALADSGVVRIKEQGEEEAAAVEAPVERLTAGDDAAADARVIQRVPVQGSRGKRCSHCNVVQAK